MPIADPTHAHAHKRADARRHAPSRRSALPLRASLFAIASLGALGSFAACVPRPFTFEETGTGGGAGSSMTAGGEGGSPPTSSASGATTSSSSTGTGMSECKEGTVCNDVVPDEWEGPVLVLVSPAGGQKPPCPNGAKPQEFHKGPLGQFECTPCSGCAMMGATCSAPEIMCWYGDDCMTGFVNSWKVGVTECVEGPNPPPAEDQPGSCKLTAAPDVVSQGTCTYGGGVKVNAVEWETDVHVCAPMLTGVGDACGAGGTCEPISTGQLCVVKAGHVACPPGWDVGPLESFGNASDDRGCSQCQCNGISCSGGAYTFHDALGCAGSSMAVDQIGACVVVPNTLGSVSSSLKPSLGQVQVNQNGCAGGGQPIGAFTPTDPVTFCCKN